MIRDEGISFEKNGENGKLSELPHNCLIISIGNTNSIWPKIKPILDQGEEAPFDVYSE